MPDKTRTYVAKARYGKQGPYFDVNRVQGTISTVTSPRNSKGKYTQYNPCTHVQVSKPGGSRVDLGSNLYELDWSYLGLVQHKRLTDYALSQGYIGLDFQEDNDFDLIPFLLEWDETVSMFTKNLFQSLSYGGVTWGIRPFISDLRSLANSLESINGKLQSSYEKIIGKPITRRIPFSTSMHLGGPFLYNSSGILTIRGTIDGGMVFPDDPLKALYVFLDEIGLNVDLKVLWDVIPFSFVVDYFLPLGDFLESIHPRGWFNPRFVLKGGYSVSATVLQQPDPAWNTHGSQCEYKIYTRSPATLNLGSRPTVEPKYKSPSYRGLFNTAYLAASGKEGRGSKLTNPLGFLAGLATWGDDES